MLENTNTKQFYPGPILNRTLEITKFLFRNPEQVRLQKTALDEYGKAYDIELTYGTDYEVQKVLSSDINIEDANLTASTGQITLKSTVEVKEGEKLTAYRESALVQDTNYPRTGKFPAASHEGALDYLTMQNQEQQEQINRTLKIPISVQNFNAQMPIPMAGKALKIDSAGKNFALSDLDVDEAYNTIQQYRDETLAAKNDANAKAEIATQKANSAANSANSAANSANSAANSATAAQNTLNMAVQTITSVKTSAINEINTNKTSAINEIDSSKQSALTSIKAQQNTSVNSVVSTGNSYIKTFNNYKTEINTEKENAKDFYQKAVGWNIQYETDGEEDCLVFEDRTDEEINQAKNYIEDTRDNALTSIETAKTSALNSIESTRSSVVSSVTTAGTSVLSSISSAKTSAIQEISSTENDVVNSVITAGTDALNSINSAKTSAINEVNNAKTTTITNAQNNAISSINTAKTVAVNMINSTKTSAVNACAEQVALAKEYAQMANGWDFSYDEENEMLVFVENV